MNVLDTLFIVMKAVRVIDECQLSVNSVYFDLVRGKLEMVWSDSSVSMVSYGVS